MIRTVEWGSNAGGGWRAEISPRVFTAGILTKSLITYCISSDQLTKKAVLSMSDDSEGHYGLPLNNNNGSLREYGGFQGLLDFLTPTESSLLSVCGRELASESSACFSRCAGAQSLTPEGDISASRYSSGSSPTVQGQQSALTKMKTPSRPATDAVGPAGVGLLRLPAIRSR